MTSESTPLFQQGHLEQSDQAHVQVAFGNLQGRDSAILWTIHTSASSSTQYRSASSIQTDPPVLQSVPMPGTGLYFKEPSSVLFISSIYIH